MLNDYNNCVKESNSVKYMFIIKIPVLNVHQIFTYFICVYVN